MPFSRAKSFDLSGLRRITSDGKFIPEVDGFRLLAILLVIFDHIHGQIALHVGTVWPSVLTIADGGRRGVEFFFVISGFILGLPFARRALVSSPSDSQRPFSYRAYLLRRVTRLEPPYVLSLVLRLGLIVAVLHEDLQQLAPHFRASLFYVHNLIFADMSRVSPPTWSLEVEVQFYLLAPFLAAVFGISSTMTRRGLLIAGTLGLSVLSQLYLKDIPRATLSLAGNAQYFTAGFLLCDFYLVPWRVRVSGYLLDAVGIALLVPLLYGGGPVTAILFPLGVLAVYMAGLRGVLLPKLFAQPLISVAGGMCYSVYLTHGTVLAALGLVLRKLPFGSLPVAGQQVLLIALSLGVVFAAGTLYFVLIERPCMDPRWPRKLVALLRSHRTVPAQSP